MSRPGQQGPLRADRACGRDGAVRGVEADVGDLADEGRNVFRVEAVLDRSRAGALRPGMEGVAKIDVDHRTRFWIWTRGLRDWARLFAWKWLP
jgi:hypothetical protein